MKPKNNSAVAYVRVSTKKQDTEGYSPEAQRAAITAYAKKEGLDIKKWFEESRSGFQNLQARTSYYAMLAFIGEKKISNVVYRFADRIARNLPDFVQLESLGVHLHNLERENSFNPDNPDDYQAVADEERRIVAAKEESGRTRKKVKDAVRLMVRRGDYPGAIPPLGYWRNPMRRIGIKKRAGQIEIHPEAGPLVKKMFSIYCTGEYDYRSLAKKMFSLGLRSRHDYFVNHANVSSMLKNPFYVGRFQFGGDTSPIDGSYEPLISKELWDEAQNTRIERSRQDIRNGKDQKTFKFRGLKCSLCGCSIVAEEKKKTLKNGTAARWVYYHCSQAKGKCDLGYFKEEDLDRYFDNAFSYFKELAITPDIYENARKILEADYNSNQRASREELEAQRQELAKIEAQGRTMNTYLLSGKITPEAYNEARDVLKSHKAEVEARISELELAEESFIDVAVKSLELVSDIKMSYLQSGNPNIRHRLNKLLFRTIKLEPKNAAGTKGEKLQCLNIIYNEPFATLFQEYKNWFLEQEKLEEDVLRQEKNEWRGRRDSNSRPPA